MWPILTSYEADVVKPLMRFSEGIWAEGQERTRVRGRSILEAQPRFPTIGFR